MDIEIVSSVNVLPRSTVAALNPGQAVSGSLGVVILKIPGEFALRIEQDKATVYHSSSWGSVKYPRVALGTKIIFTVC